MALRTWEDRAKETVARKLASYEPKVVYTRALVGDGAGHLEVPNWPGYYWVRLHGDQDRLVMAEGSYSPAYDTYVTVMIDEHDIHQYRICNAGAYSTGGTGGGTTVISGPYLRACRLVSFDITDYTATVLVGEVELTGVQVLWSIRPDLMKEGTYAMITLADTATPTYVLIGLFGGAPDTDPAFDPEVGHKHRGIGNDGPRINEGDLVIVE